MNETKKLVLPSEPESLIEADAFTEQIMNAMDFSQDQRDDIAISVSEAVGNAIIHGNLNDPQKSVTLVLRRIRNGLKIVVSDEGNGFDANNIPDPTKPENLLAEAGRGILIIHHLMDDVEIDTGKGGTTVSMIKYLS